MTRQFRLLLLSCLPSAFRPAFLFWICSLFVILAQPVAAADSPVVRITPTEVTASGVTPGTEVVFFGVGVEPKGYHVEVHRWSGVVTDTTHSGTATFTLEKPVTWNVIWIVADLRNGHYTVASTPGFPTMTPDRPQFRLKRDIVGLANQIGYSRPFVDGLYLEAGGAWILRGADGIDSNGQGKGEGETTIDLLKATPLMAGAAPPRSLSPGGTLLIIDVSRLDVLTVKIDESLLAGAR
jgi:hypothetical protein